MSLLTPSNLYLFYSWRSPKGFIVATARYAEFIFRDVRNSLKVKVQGHTIKDFTVFVFHSPIVRPGKTAPEPLANKLGSFALRNDHLFLLLLQTLSTGWPAVLSIEKEVAVNNDQALIQTAFRCLGFICSDFLPNLPIGFNPLFSFPFARKIHTDPSLIFLQIA